MEMVNNRFYAAIDPGCHGAIAIFNENGQFHDVHDIPVYTDKKGKRHIDAKELYSLLLNYKILHAYIENVFSSPQMGVTSAFNFGRTLGAIQGVLSASEIPYTMILPRRWKDYHRLLNKEKDMAREKVIHLFPKHMDKFRRKKDIDRAEAVLIGLTGLGQMRAVND